MTVQKGSPMVLGEQWEQSCELHAAQSGLGQAGTRGCSAQPTHHALLRVPGLAHFHKNRIPVTKVLVRSGQSRPARGQADLSAPEATGDFLPTSRTGDQDPCFCGSPTRPRQAVDMYKHTDKATRECTQQMGQAEASPKLAGSTARSPHTRPHWDSRAAPTPGPERGNSKQRAQTAASGAWRGGARRGRGCVCWDTPCSPTPAWHRLHSLALLWSSLETQGQGGGRVHA